MDKNTVITTSGYQIYTGPSAFSDLNGFLKEKEYNDVDFFILTDQNTNHHCLPLLLDNIKALKDAEVVTIAPGEESKSIDMCRSLWRSLALKGAGRNDVVLNLGGGVVCDLGGFVASTFKRGMRFIHIPTSLLAMVDASVGGKTGINLDRLKNMVGTFTSPEAVFIQPDFLATLDKRNYLSGLAEIVKHALIADMDYWEKIKLTQLSDFDQWCRLISKSVELKGRIVEKDYKESGLRKVLNFGHTIGHAMESYSFEKDNTPLLHGEAIAIGMICEAYISHKVCGLSRSSLDDITAYLHSAFNHYRVDPTDYHKLIEFMKHDKKRIGQAMNFALLNSIGNPVPEKEVGIEVIIDGLNYYHLLEK